MSEFDKGWVTGESTNVPKIWLTCIDLYVRPLIYHSYTLASALRKANGHDCLGTAIQLQPASRRTQTLLHPASHLHTQ